MTRSGLLSATGVLLAATVFVSACGADPGGPAVVTATVLDHGTPVVGAIVELRLLNDSSATAVTDSAGRVRVALADAEGPGLLDVARDTEQEQRVHAPLLLAPGDSADLEVAIEEDPGHQARYLSETRMARWGRVAQNLAAIEHGYYAAYDEWVAADQPGDLKVDYRGAVDSVRAWLDDEDDPEVRSALWVTLLSAGTYGEPVTATEADRALEETAPDAAIWAQRPRELPWVVRSAADRAEGTAGDSAGPQELVGRRELAIRRAEAYTNRVIEAYAGTDTQAEMLFAAIRAATAANRGEEARAYYARLEAAHPESPWTAGAKDQLPNPDVQVGSPVPDVALPALDSTAPPITPDQLAGPATLVDFWAVWCTPCVAEMPVIHDAYERFHDRGFDVVSISFDASRDDVARFRGKYPMPWRHAFVGADSLSDGEVVDAWGVHGLPATFLIGPDGRILALEDELRGARLEETLERVLGD